MRAAQIIEIVATAKPGAPLRDVSVLLVGARRSRDVDVDPRGVADELLEEQAGRERAAPALAGVAHVGDLGLELLGEPGGQRQPPHVLAGAGGGREPLGGERLVVAHHARGVRPERDHARAGQRREVEDRVGLRAAARR